MSISQDQILEAVAQMTVMDVVELVKKMEEIVRLFEWKLTWFTESLGGTFAARISPNPISSLVRPLCLSSRIRFCRIH